MDYRYVPLLQNAKEITEENYDPKKKIQAFWDRYGVNGSRLHILNMFLGYRGETELQEGLREEEMEQFSHDLMGLLMAYYVACHEKINLEDIIIPIDDTPEKSEQDKHYAGILYTILGLRQFEQKFKT